MREAIWSTRSRYRMGCPPAVSSMECASTRLEVGVPLFPMLAPNSGESERNAFKPNARLLIALGVGPLGRGVCWAPLPWLTLRKSLYMGLPVRYAHSQWFA